MYVDPEKLDEGQDLLPYIALTDGEKLKVYGKIVDGTEENGVFSLKVEILSPALHKNTLVGMRLDANHVTTKGVSNWKLVSGRLGVDMSKAREYTVDEYIGKTAQFSLVAKDGYTNVAFGGANKVENLPPDAAESKYVRPVKAAPVTDDDGNETY